MLERLTEASSRSNTMETGPPPIDFYHQRGIGGKRKPASLPKTTLYPRRSYGTKKCTSYETTVNDRGLEVFRGHPTTDEFK